MGDGWTEVVGEEYFLCSKFCSLNGSGTAAEVRHVRPLECCVRSCAFMSVHCDGNTDWALVPMPATVMSGITTHSYRQLTTFTYELFNLICLRFVK